MRIASTVLALWLALWYSHAPQRFLMAQDRAKQDQELLDQAQSAFASKDFAKALELAGQYVQSNPNDVTGYAFLGRIHLEQGDHQAAVTNFNKVLELNPRFPGAHQRRGEAFFKLRKFKESIADFDAVIAQDPSQEPGHWQRGISYYYAEMYDEGAKQFEGYQSVDSNDVENAVWRFLCQAKKDGLEKAKAQMLPIERDRRVPLMEVYDLFLGKKTAEDVLAATEANQVADDQRKEQRFYAHLYLGLYYDAAGEHDKAIAHVKRSVDEFRVDGYMGYVAEVHLKELEAQ